MGDFGLRPELVVSCSVCGHVYGSWFHRDDMPDFEDEIACPCMQDHLKEELKNLRKQARLWGRAS